jgi:hypothetical protein
VSLVKNSSLLLNQADELLPKVQRLGPVGGKNRKQTCDESELKEAEFHGVLPFWEGLKLKWQ